MRYYKAIPLTFLILYLLHVVVRAGSGMVSTRSSFPIGARVLEFGEEMVDAALALSFVFAIGLLLALVLTGLASGFLRRDRWWIGSTVVFLILIAPWVFGELFGRLPDSAVDGGCVSVAAGQLTPCGAELQFRASIELLLWSLCSAVLYAAVFRLLWRRPGTPEPQS